MSPEEFRRYGHQIIDWLADYQTGLVGRPVQATTEPGDVAAALPASPPEGGEDFAAVLADLDRIVLPGLSLWQHPRFFGYFPANAEPAGILGDLVSTGLGVLGLSWQSSPAVTEIEEVTTDWVRQMVGLSDAWRGVIQDTASTIASNASGRMAWMPSHGTRRRLSRPNPASKAALSTEEWLCAET